MNFQSNNDEDTNRNLLILLEHCSICDVSSSCCFRDKEECKQMKTLVVHFSACELFPCVICKDMTDLTKLHSSNCSSTRCKVEKCNIIRHSMMCSVATSIVKQPRILKIVSDLPNNIVQTNPIKSTLYIDTTEPQEPKKTTTVYHCGKCGQPKNSSHKCTMMVSPQKKPKDTKKRKIDENVITRKPSDEIIMLPNRCENSFNMALARENDDRSIYISKHNKTKIAIEERKIRMIEKREDFIKKKMSITTKDIPKSNQIPRTISSASMTTLESARMETFVSSFQEEKISHPKTPYTVTEENNDYMGSICLTPSSNIDEVSLFDSLSFDFSDSDDINSILFNEDIFSN